jgi:general secretion pathway protein A
MFEQFYGLTSLPFLIMPDARFYFDSSGHSRALAHLTYGLAQGDGFIVITGEVGAGKTTLIDHLLGLLDPHDYVAARIATTQLSPTALLRMIMGALDMPSRPGDKAGMLRQLCEFFESKRDSGTRILLIIDEAQNLPFPTLEELRMLSNLAIDSRTPLQTCLVGQPQFRNTIMSAKAEQLRQRICTSYHLDVLRENEIGAYVRHRLRVSSWTGDPSFDEGAFPALYAHTNGVPRRINSLCSRLLLHAFLNESHNIGAADVTEVAEEWQAEHRPSGTGPASPVALGDAKRNRLAKLTGRLDSFELRLAGQEDRLNRALKIMEHCPHVR